VAESRRPKTLILDLYGRYAAQFQGWIAVGDLVHLMGVLAVDEQAVRSAVSRMTRRGLLRPEVRGKVRGYATTPDADELLADGDRRIYVSMEPASLADGWVLLSFSMPENERDKRHVLRSNLMWLGLGNLSSALWIGPRRLLDDVRSTIASLGFEQYVDVFTAEYDGFGDAATLAKRSWDLDHLANEYSKFITEQQPQLVALRRSRRAVDPEHAFVVYTLALHHWRKFPYLDPGLPTELLPHGWPGRVAADLFQQLRTRLEPAAFDYAAATVAAR
jgi:phenylacetic acid degradation operon negative regulatory protein